GTSRFSRAPASSRVDRTRNAGLAASRPNPSPKRTSTSNATASFGRATSSAWMPSSTNSSSSKPNPDVPPNYGGNDEHHTTSYPGHCPVHSRHPAHHTPRPDPHRHG